MANLNDDKPQQPIVEGAPAAEPAQAANPPADAHCPNCNGPGIRKGKVIACQVCDAAFRYTKEGPKLDELGPFDDHEQRITQLEGGTIAEPPEPAKEEPPAEPEPPAPAKPEPAKAHVDDDGI